MVYLMDGAANLGGGELSGGGPQTVTCLEHALRSEVLAQVAAGVAHDVKNPLNAMALQLALLGEKLAEEQVAASHLAALKDQVARVNEVMRRFLDVMDPAGQLGVDVQALTTDAIGLVAHEARRRHVSVVVDAGAGAVRTSTDPGRVGRLVLGILAATLAETPERGRLALRVAREAGGVAITFERDGAAPGPALAALAAAEPAGTLEVSHGEAGARLVLRLAGEERP